MAAQWAFDRPCCYAETSTETLSSLKTALCSTGVYLSHRYPLQYAFLGTFQRFEKPEEEDIGMSPLSRPHICHLKGFTGTLFLNPVCQTEGIIHLEALENI